MGLEHVIVQQRDGKKKTRSTKTQGLVNCSSLILLILFPTLIAILKHNLEVI